MKIFYLKPHQFNTEKKVPIFPLSILINLRIKDASGADREAFTYARMLRLYMYIYRMLHVISVQI